MPDWAKIDWKNKEEFEEFPPLESEHWTPEAMLSLVLAVEKSAERAGEK